MFLTVLRLEEEGAFATTTCRIPRYLRLLVVILPAATTTERKERKSLLPTVDSPLLRFTFVAFILIEFLCP